MRAKVSKTRRAGWGSSCVTTCSVPSSTAFRLVRIATPTPRYSRLAQRDCGVPVFSPHDLRHRRITLRNAHDDIAIRLGLSWPEIGRWVVQRNIATTADTSHVLMDYGEIDRSELLARVRTTHPPAAHPGAETVYLQRRSRSGAHISEWLSRSRDRAWADPRRLVRRLGPAVDPAASLDLWPVD